jgi:hypothetical protein
MPTSATAGYTVADLCRRWRIGEDKLRGFLRRGELVGVNVATDPAGKPQWRVTAESVAAFESRRSSVPAPKLQRRRKMPIGFVDFFPDL